MSNKHLFANMTPEQLKALESIFGYFDGGEVRYSLRNCDAMCITHDIDPAVYRELREALDNAANRPRRLTKSLREFEERIEI